MSRDILAYCAGLFDGEGCLVLYAYPHPGSAKYPYIRGQAAVDIREEIIVDIFVAAFGGMKIYKPKKVEGHSPTWVWKATGGALRKFLTLMDGYLILKRKQLKLMKSFQDIRINKGRASSPITEEEYRQMEAHRIQMRKLNERGVGK